MTIIFTQLLGSGQPWLWVFRMHFPYCWMKNRQWKGSWGDFLNESKRPGGIVWIKVIGGGFQRPQPVQCWIINEVWWPQNAIWHQCIFHQVFKFKKSYKTLILKRKMCTRQFRKLGKESKRPWMKVQMMFMRRIMCRRNMQNIPRNTADRFVEIWVIWEFYYSASGIFDRNKSKKSRLSRNQLITIEKFILSKTHRPWNFTTLWNNRRIWICIEENAKNFHYIRSIIRSLQIHFW